MKLKTLVVWLFALLVLVPAVAFADGDEPRYDIQSAGSGTYGTTLVKVYVYSKKGKVSDNELKRAAVHGVLFRGVEGRPSQPPLAGSAAAEKEKADYFNAFFGEEGMYLNYASVLSESYERIKMKKGGYKIGAVVQVSKNKLRQELERAGAIRGLSSGF